MEDVVEPVDVLEGDVGAEVDLLAGRHDLIGPELEELRCEKKLVCLGLLGNSGGVELVNGVRVDSAEHEFEHLVVVLLLELPEDLGGAVELSPALLDAGVPEIDVQLVVGLVSLEVLRYFDQNSP